MNIEFAAERQPTLSRQCKQKISMTAFHKSSVFNFQYSRPSVFALFTALSLVLSAQFSAAQTWHAVRWVNDGDTIVLMSGQRVRYIGINAPEIDHKDQKAQPYGYRARAFNQDLIRSGKIRLEYDIERFDRYGRVLAYVFLEDGTFLNARLLQAGLAFCLYRKPNVKYHNILLKAQQDAMELKRGLWRCWTEPENKYIGNQASQRFHLSSCPVAQKIKSKNKITFFKKWDAFSQGYAPSKKCIDEFWSYKMGE